MQSTRRYERYSVDIIGINGSMVLAKYLKIINISIGGICIQTEKRLNIGSQYTVKLDGKSKSLNVKGIIMWSLLKESNKDLRGNVVPIYTAGMKFIDVSEEKIKEIANFIEDNRLDIDRKVDLFSSNGLRIFVRIHIEGPNKAVLDYHYKVKNLSLGGALIESIHALDVESLLPMEMTLSEDKSVKFLGRVAFCRELEDRETEQYDVGISFLKMSEKDRETLTEFIVSIRENIAIK